MIQPIGMLNTRGLEIGYGEKVICRDINVKVNTNEMVCLLGQNGVGKSTLLRTLSNLQPAIAGSVLINNRDMVSFDHQDLSRTLGIVTTDRVALPNMTVYELVSLGRYPYTNWLGRLTTTDEQKINESVALCRIDYIIDKKMGDLSDGQKQKAMIARALAQDTKIILLDEPTAHLDLINRAEIMQLLSEIKVDKSIVISTHELALSMQFADKLWLMNFNQPIQAGTPEDLALSGAINKSFHEEQFEIDVLTGNVKFQNPAYRYVHLIGEGKAFEWTKHALERLGYGLHAKSETSIEVELKPDGLAWRIKEDGRSVSGVTIDELARHLDK